MQMCARVYCHVKHCSQGCIGRFDPWKYELSLKFSEKAIGNEEGFQKIRQHNTMLDRVRNQDCSLRGQKNKKKKVKIN